jgi:hypothetical protein
MRWTEHVAHTGENRKEYRVLVGECERRTALRHTYRWQSVSHLNSYSGSIMIIDVIA